MVPVGRGSGSGVGTSVGGVTEQHQGTCPACLQHTSCVILEQCSTAACRRTYTKGGCYMKDDSWSAEPREGLISGYYSSS